MNSNQRILPRERAVIDFNRPGHFYGHAPHYYGYRIHALPPHYHHHYYWGHEFFFHEGIYYRCWDGYYYVCRPPFGVCFNRALYELDLILCDFAYFNTVYRTYDAINDNYRTIQEQNEIIAQNNATIAAQNQVVANNKAVADESYSLASSLGLIQSYADANVQYYYDDGVFFVKDGDDQYKTIVPPAGAIISVLPDDYETVTLQGKEYYKVDNTIFRMIVNDGKAYFEVLGQFVS